MHVQSLGQQDPLEREMATHSSTLAWEEWTEEPGGLQPDMTEQLNHYLKCLPSMSLAHLVTFDTPEVLWGFCCFLLDRIITFLEYSFSFVPSFGEIVAHAMIWPLSCTLGTLFNKTNRPLLSWSRGGQITSKCLEVRSAQMKV